MPSAVIAWCYDVPLSLDFHPFETGTLVLTVVQHGQNALARSGPCGHAPLRKPTRLLGAAREEFPRRLHADADGALWRRSGACLIRCVLPPVPQVVLVAFLVQNGESNWLQGLMLVVAYCIVSLGFFVHCDQNGEDEGCPSPFRKSEA